MSLSFPYTYISCPCSDRSRQVPASTHNARGAEVEEEVDAEEVAFNPHDPRSAYSLFPPEHLLYCEDCHDIKCPRCVTEEIISYYCPSCLFETPSSMVRSEGNRCARNCFNCPVCTSQMVTVPLGEPKDGFVLNCNYCMWSTLDIGIKLEKPTNIRAQLDRIANGGKSKQPSKPADSTDPSRKSSLAQEPYGRKEQQEAPDAEPQDQSQLDLDPATRFKALRTFYEDQITSSSTGENGLPTSALDLAYSSPSSLARIMNLYSNIGSSSFKKARQKPSLMREAISQSEGLQFSDVKGLAPPLEYADTASLEQRSYQHPNYLGNPEAQSLAELRPMPALLRTKRSKRCAACKHILVKPEFKPTSTRYRIKLIALNYLPFVSLKPVPVSGGLRPLGPDGGDVVLEPGKPSQWIMTLKNPLFENVSVSLGSPNVTPGKHGHKVTVLCPQFEIGKNGDVWDDALNKPANKAIMSPGGGEQIAGKLYDHGRNWASVVIEIVPTFVDRESGRELEDDEDVVEVPVRVRVQWKQTDVEADAKKKSEKVLDEPGDVDDGQRELSYWMVLGIGRVAC